MSESSEGTPEVPQFTADLVEQTIRFMKSLHRVKATLTREMPDRAAYGLLFPLVEGDRRAAELAELIHSDPSTVSRHISHLVTNDLVHRVPDQHDGRAALLSLTDKGRGLCESLVAHRSNVLGLALREWNESDAKQLTVFLTRLNNDMEAHHQEVIDGFRDAYDKAENQNTDPSDSEELA